MMKKIFFPAFLIVFFLPAFLLSCSDGQKKEKVNTDTLPADLKALWDQIEKDPKNAELYYNRAEYYFKKRKMDEAVADMSRAIENDPNKVKYYIRISDYYFTMNKTRNTRDELVKAVKIDPKNTEVLLKLGELYYLVKNYDTAVFYIDRALIADPENAKAYYQKGMAKLEAGDSASAVSAFQAAAEKDPKNYDAFVQLGMLYGAHKNKLAAEYFNNALKLKPGGKDAMYQLGLFYQNMGEAENARNVYNNLVKLDPQNVFVVYNLGYILLVLENKPGEAKEFFNKAMGMEPAYADAVYMRGLCYEKMGDKKNAAADYNSTLLIEPQHQLALAGLKRLSGKK